MKKKNGVYDENNFRLTIFFLFVIIAFARKSAKVAQLVEHRTENPGCPQFDSGPWHIFYLPEEGINGVEPDGEAGVV